MATTDLLSRHPDPTDEQIRDGLAGNLCRCTGYINIEAAVRTAAAALRR
jgi:aerobic-type carbon monoxide dehydrogenase small subunit (CoxS/CutS family)